MKLLTSILTAVGITAAFSTLFGNRYLSVDKYVTVCRRLPKGANGKKIVLLADLHKKKFGRDYCCLADSVRACEPDVIIFAGDLYSRNDRHRGRTLKLMKELTEIAPVYYSPGNHELFDPEYYAVTVGRLDAMGVRVLNNERCELKFGEDSVDLYGLKLPLRYYINRDYTFHDLPRPSQAVLEDLLGRPDPDRCSLLIAHDPLFFEEYARWGADMVFSGHVHGGLIRLPFLGGLLSPERKFFPEYTKGLYRLGTSVMALTSGLGKFRFNNPSQVMCLELWNREKKPRHPKGAPWDIGQ